MVGVHASHFVQEVNKSQNHFFELRFEQTRNDLVQFSPLDSALLRILPSFRDRAFRNVVLRDIPLKPNPLAQGPPPAEVDLKVLFAAVAPFCVRILPGGIV